MINRFMKHLPAEPGDNMNKACGVSLVGYWFTATSIIIAGLMLVFHPDMLSRCLQEDAIVENLSALFLLMTGIVLLYGAKQQLNDDSRLDRRSHLKGGLLILAGMVFFWAAGEEISWGQRIFGFGTPDALVVVNAQNETNLHNLNTRFFNNGLETIILLIILLPAILRMSGRDHLFGLVLPSFPLIMGFQLVACYVAYHYLKPQDYTAYLILPVLHLYFYRHKESDLAHKVSFSSLLVIFIAVINIKFSSFFPGNGPREFREYLFSFLCLVYALEIFFDIRNAKMVDDRLL